MDKMLKNEMGLSRALKTAILVGLTFFLTVSVAFCALLYSSTKTTVRDQAIRNITNICQLNEDSLNRAIENREKLLETISARLMKNQIYDPEAILDELDDFAGAYECYHMGVVDEAGILYRTSGEIVDVSGREMTKQIWDDEPHITASYFPSDNEEYMVNMFSHPVFEDGKLRCVLVATYYSKDLAARMNIKSLRGNGFTFLLNQQSEVVIYPHKYENQEYNKLMKFIDGSRIVIPSDSGDQFFEYNGERYYARYEKLNVNDWYLMTCARENDVFAEAKLITRNSFIALGIMWLFIAVSVVATFYSMYRFQEKLKHNYYYDELLDIGNINALEVYFRKLPAEALSNMYLVVFDIDKFKEFNYIYGNENGDRLLRYIVQVFHEEVPDVLLFRQSSDYFITLDNSRNQEELVRKVQKVQERYARDIAAGRIQPFDTSGGVRKVDLDVELRQLISDAIIARDTIKGNHLLHHVFYDEAIRNQRLSYMAMESVFSSALKNHEFHVYYQPKYNMETGAIIGAEALARWIRPDGSMISPAEFIPCFEASRQISQLDAEILKIVCRQMKEMQEEGIEIKPVSVNLSRIHLQQPDILPKITEIVRESGIDPRNLSFEITERALTEGSIPLQTIAEGLRLLGSRVDMDDYGIGASGPRALATNCFDVVKLDKSFVDDIGDGYVEAVIEATVHLARKLGLEVLAEGVEEQYQVECLMELGCMCAQGFYYSQPITREEYQECLRAGANPVKHAIRVSEYGKYAHRSYRNCFSEDFCTALDTTGIPIYIIDSETFEIIYCNETLQHSIGSNPLGEYCHKAIRGLDDYCPDCAVRRWLRTGINQSAEYRLPSGQWILVKASPLHWRGRDLFKVTCTDITEQKKLEEELRLHNKEYSAVVYQSTSGVMRYDIATGTAAVNVNANLERVEEYTIPNYIQVVRDSGIIDPDSLPAAKQMFADILAGLPSRGYDLHLLPPQGENRWCHLDYTHIEDEEGRPYRAVVSFYDNTEQREKEVAYQRWNARLNAIMNEYTAYMEVNLSKDIIEAEGRYGEWEKSSGGRRYSESLERMAAVGVYEEDKYNFRIFFHRERLLGQYLAGNREGTLEYRTMLEGAVQWYKTELQMVSDPFTGDIKASILVSNVDVDLREKEHLARKAERDIMTGLYNHATAETLMKQAMDLSTGERCCLLIIDLDDLRIINSTLGHPEGDRAIRALADCMKAQFRKSDIMGRIGGDEFAVLLRNAPETEGLRPALTSFMQRISEIKIGPLNDKPVHASVGGTIGTAGVDSFDTLYKQADLALFYTKAMGKNGYHMYESELEKREFSYKPGSSASLTSIESFDASELKKLLQALSIYSPMVISANLTRNSYYMMEYMDYTTQRSKDEGTYDGLIQDGYESFHPDDRKSFLACFAREHALRAYSEGRRMIQHTGRQLGDDNVYRMMRTVAILIKEEDTGDICGISFTHAYTGDTE